ncbi:DUF3500 domain-containing protein [Caballeronia sp. HLA56]
MCDAACSIRLVALIASAAMSALIAPASYGNTEGSSNTSAPVMASAETRAVVSAATAFLDSLSANQRRKALFAFAPQKAATSARFARTGPAGGVMPGSLNGATPADHPAGALGTQAGFVGEQYGQAIWSNYPVSDVPRPGLQLGGLSAPQHAAAMHLLQVSLSARGYQKVLDIMGSDQALSVGEKHFAAGEDVYTIGIFGTPSAATPWMLEFGGHHLGLNVVIAGARGVLTPTLTGAQPSVYTSHDKTVRVLAGENDKAFALLNALDGNQRKQAILNYRVNDLVLGPGHDGESIVPEGLKVSAMNTQQKAMLLDLISEWAGIVNDAYAAPHLQEIKAGLNDTWFAWSGPTTHEPGKNGSAYYRIQGPKVIIEFSPQGVGGDPTMHVHTIYRDPTNDYGHAFTAP